MFAVIKHLNGTRHNMRHESQWFWDVPFRKTEQKFLLFSHFFFHSQTKKLLTNTHTYTHSGKLKRDTYRLWTLGGHGGVRDEQGRRQRGERDLAALHSHPGLPDARTRPTGLVNLKARMEGGRLAGVCREGKLQAAVGQAAGRAARGRKWDRQKRGGFRDASSFSFLFLLVFSGVT